MLFCGQCGFQLTPADTQCPRCGMPVDANLTRKDEVQPDAPTTASPSLQLRPLTQVDAMQTRGGNPQPLVLGPAQTANNYDYGTGVSNTRPPYPNAGSNASYAGYPQNAGGYPSQAGYPPQGASQAGYPQSGSNYGQQGYMGGSPSNASQYQAQPASSTKGRTAALTLVLVGLLLILISMTLWIMQMNHAFGSTAQVSGNTVLALTGTLISLL